MSNNVGGMSHSGGSAAPGTRSGSATGANQFGELGLGDTTDRTAPVAVPNAQYDRWRANAWGPLGIPSATALSSAPLTIANIGGTPTAVSVGFHHACALRSDGKVMCWGRNNYGQLGNNDTSVPLSSDPVQVQNL